MANGDDSVTEDELERVTARRIRRDHADVLEGIGACADRVVADWDGEWTTDRRAIVDPLERCLERTGILPRLPDVLADAVTAAGYDLPATPVPAPPYVVVTSRGPMLRATIAPGRLVIRFEAFDIWRASEPRYRRLDGIDLTASLE